jgi:hypothetical protein
MSHQFTPGDTICGYPVHPTAALFPLILGAEFGALVADIRDNGQMEPIVIDSDGVLIDGRNRGRACDLLGIAPNVKTYDGADVLQYVISHNLHRRHLTDGQRAMIAARIATRKPGEHDGKPCGTTELPPTTDEAADLFKVKAGSVYKAKVVIKHGTESLQNLVANGGAPVLTAARVATELAPADQDEYVKHVLAGDDPVKAAPPGLIQSKWRASRKAEADEPKPSVAYGNRRKHADQIDALIVAVSGVVAAFQGISALDASVTSEEATRLTGGLSEQIRGLTRINNLIKERITQ